jgi:hypothetical protein
MDIKQWIRLQWDRVGAWVCIGAGVIVLIVGWVGISARVYPGEELPYILSGGIGGVFLLGLGAMLWLSADLRDEWRKLDRIEKAIYEKGLAVTDGQVPYVTQQVYASPAVGSSPPPPEPAAGPSETSYEWEPDGDPQVVGGERAVASRRRERPLTARPLSASRSRASGRVSSKVEE